MWILIKMFALWLYCNERVLSCKNPLLQLKDFVKHGKERGFVEIELSDPEGVNPVIRRELNAYDNKSVWRLNGNTSSQNEVRNTFLCWYFSS